MIKRLLLETERTGPNKEILFGDDIKQDVKITLGNYLRDITAKNEYPIQGGSQDFSFTNPDGSTADLSDPNANGQDNYLNKLSKLNPDTKIPSLFSRNSSYLDTDTPFEIKKGKLSSNAPSGDEIYADIDKEKDNSKFVKRIQDVLKTNNIFNQQNTFIPNNVSGEEDSNIGIGIIQRELGVHLPRKFVDAPAQSSTTNENVSFLKIKDLKKIGLITMLKASGEIYSPSNPDDFGQNLLARAGAIVPGAARIGQKVPLSRFSSTKILEEIDPSFKKPSLDNGIKKEEIYSYGNVNNYLTPFAGLSSVSSVIGTGILVATVSTMLRSLTTVIRTVQPASTIRNLSTLSDNVLRNESLDTTAQRRKNQKLGSYLGKTGLLQINTSATNHDYFRCVDRGISIFFGLQGNSVAQVLENASVQVAQSHGYYNVILRNIIRSATDDILSSIGVAVGSVSPQTNLDGINPGFSKTESGLLGLPIDPLAMINKFNNSPLLKFLNTLANIGDISLNLDDQGFQGDISPISGLSQFSLGFEDNTISSIDAIPGLLRNSNEINNGVLQAKNRIFERQNILAWGNTTTPSLYWFPNTVLDGAKSYFGSDSNNISKAKASIKDKVISNSGIEGRIEKQIVEELEIKLEADYMPFYFHDLRTNEIISFHAFLEDISDQYNPQYEETEAYGRIGKVLTYKNTNRTIGLSFKMVATNEQDFDAMWWKINKFITMVYPQYSEGRRLTDGTNKFIQPFSQIPTSSPMIRMRLGDIFKSNYNRFSLARLFGISSDNFQVGNERTTRTNFSQRREIEQRIEQTRKRMNGELPNTPRFNQGEKAFLRSNYSPGNLGVSRVYLRYIDNQLNSVNPIANNSGSPSLVLQWDTEINILNYTNGSYVVQISNTSNNGSYIVRDEDLYPNSTEYERIARNGQTNLGNPSTTSNSNIPQSIRGFLDPINNSIYKSFETTKGKGLAGFITDLSFDMNNTIWDTNRYNARAPMLLKASIQFSPIHDINPGIDSEGLNTAPIYNVGNILETLTNENAADQQDRHKQSFANSRNFIRTNNNNTNPLVRR